MSASSRPLSFNDLCKALGKGPNYIRNLQTHLELHFPRKEQGYSKAYCHFLDRVIFLRAFSVPVDDIADLLRKEKKILELLHLDSMSDSPTWYLDMCPEEPNGTGTQLLLTGHELGFPVSGEVIQSNLDFKRRQAELFTSQEIGEDVRKVLRLYHKQLDKVRDRISAEKPILERALFWSEQAFWPDQDGG
jgi:hypothetical protein